MKKNIKFNTISFKRYASNSTNSTHTDYTEDIKRKSDLIKQVKDDDIPNLSHSIINKDIKRLKWFDHLDQDDEKMEKTYEKGVRASEYHIDEFNNKYIGQYRIEKWINYIYKKY